MKADLIYCTPLWVIANGIRQSHDTTNKADSWMIDQSEQNMLKCPFCGCQELTEVFTQNNCVYNTICNDCRANLDYHIGTKDYDLIKRVGFKFKHESVLEHSMLSFEFEASRALLQELSRHRIGVSPTIKSTRYTLKELRKEPMFTWLDGREKLYQRASKYLYLVPDEDGNIYNAVNHASIKALENLRQLVASRKFSNDRLKYALPEAYKFKGQVTFNLRSLIHLLELRIDKSALHEFRELSVAIIDELTEDYKELVLSNDKIKKNYFALKGNDNG